MQSPVASPAALEHAILTFLDARPNALRNLSDEAFAQHKAGLISDLTERDKNLRQRSQRLWRDLDLGYTNFDSNQQLADAVGELSQGSDGGLHGEAEAKSAPPKAHHLQHGQVHGASRPRGTDRGPDLVEACSPNSRRNGGRESSNARP